MALSRSSMLTFGRCRDGESHGLMAEQLKMVHDNELCLT